MNILLRQALANQPSNPRAWLLTLQTSVYTGAMSAGGNIVSTSVNGKSVSVSVPSGFDKKTILDATEYALKFIEAGGDPANGVTNVTMANFRQGGLWGVQ